MSKEKLLLRKDQEKINGTLWTLRHNLANAQKYLDWYHSIDFGVPLKGIIEVKKFLTNPHHVYEQQVKRHLSDLTGLKTLPGNLDSFKEMYEIPNPQAYSVSGQLGFEYLQIDGEGKLFYSQELYDKIEAENTFYATPQQAQTLQELERTWNNLQSIKKIMSRGSMDNEFYDRKINEIFDGLLKPHAPFGRDGGNLTKWDLSKLQKITDSGFGQLTTKN